MRFESLKAGLLPLPAENDTIPEALPLQTVYSKGRWSAKNLIMQEQERVELVTPAREEAAPEAVVSEPAAAVSPVDNPVARAQEPQPVTEPEPLIQEQDSSGRQAETQEAEAEDEPPPQDEEISRLRQTATQMAHDAARVLLDAADGEGGFRGGDIRRRELMKLRSSVMEYLREHERRTHRRIFEDEEDRQVLGLD
jgi:hypothetical protein